MAKVWTVAIGVALTAALAACGEGEPAERPTLTPSASPIPVERSPTPAVEATGEPGESKFISVTPEPAAHEAFLAWFQEYASQHSFSTDIEPVGIQAKGPCWEVRDYSANEYLYSYALCPLEGITSARVFRQDGAWKAEQAHFQVSVGKPSWQEILDRILQSYTPGLEVRTILEGDEFMVVALVGPEGPPGFENTYRFIRGDDGLWRGYGTFDALHGGYGTPEDALIAYALKNLPGLPVLGGCAQAEPTRDAGKVCWTLKDDTGDRRTYVIGATFSEGEVVEIVAVVDSLMPAWTGLPFERFPY